MKTRAIRILSADLKRMRTDCLTLYIQAHPEKKGEKVSDREMFTSLIQYYTS